MSSFTVTGLISKLEHRDRDFRYMASSDLLAELQKESFKPDSDGEKKLCRSILKARAMASLRQSLCAIAESQKAARS